MALEEKFLSIARAAIATNKVVNAALEYDEAASTPDKTGERYLNAIYGLHQAVVDYKAAIREVTGDE